MSVYPYFQMLISVKIEQIWTKRVSWHLQYISMLQFEIGPQPRIFSDVLFLHYQIPYISLFYFTI